ncbi:MAG: ATP-binding protein [Polyangia bacterium]
MNLQSLPALLASIVTFAIGAAVALRDAQRARRLFSVFSLAVASWLLATFVHSTMGWEAAHVVALSFALPIPILAYRFFAVFVTQIAGEMDAPQRLLVTPRWMLPVAGALLVVLLYTALFTPGQFHHTSLFSMAYAVYVYGGLFASALLARNAYRRTLGRTEKARLSYLYVGALISIALSAYDSAAPLVSSHVHLPTTGYVFTVTYMYFLSQALFRYRLLDLNELLGRMSVLAAFVFLLSTIYGLLVAWVPSNQSGLFFFNSIVASLVIFILFEPLRGVIEGQIQGWLFRERWALKAEIDRARTELVNTIDLPDAVAVTMRHLEESHRVTHASVYLLDRDTAGYDLYGAVGPRPVERLDAAARRLFFERLQTRTGAYAAFAPISIEQLEREVETLSVGGKSDTEALDAIARTLDEMKAALCLPLVVTEDQHVQIVGLLCLRDERLRDAFASEEIELLRGLAGQLAISVKNSNLYDRMKERDRLAALGEMAAGLAHEIRNPLGAIKGAAQLLLPASGVPEGEGEFLTIIVEETNRLNRVVSQFLDYARPYRGALDILDVNDVIRRTIQLLPPSAADAPTIDVALELADALPVARGDAEQLRQVFLNLGLNALQSMPEGGRLSIATLQRPPRGGSPALLEVRFRDTGKGIPTAVLKSLFIPFFTTREGGTGLGLPISQRIVENHGGRIEVRSREGNGSTFSVLLPIHSAT